MAVALKRHEFEGADFYEPGALTYAFADKSGFAANEPVFGSLKLVSGTNEPKADEDGRILDTTERLEQYQITKEPFAFEHKTDVANLGYSVQILDMAPVGIKGNELNNGQDSFSTSAGRMQVYVNPDAQSIREEKKRREEADFQAILNVIEDSNAYMRELEAKIAEIDEKLENVRQRREELLQDELLAGDLGGATVDERRANKRRVAQRLGIGADRFTDASGNIDYDAMDRAIKEELARQREQLAREERELREQREVYDRELKEYQAQQRQKGQEVLKAEADGRRATIQQMRSENATITDSLAQKAVDLDLDAVLSIGMKSASDPAPEAAVTTTKIQTQNVSSGDNTYQFSAAPRSTGSFAEGIGLLSNNTSGSFSSIQLTAQFVKASDPKIEPVLAENILQLDGMYARQNLQASVNAYRV